MADAVRLGVEEPALLVQDKRIDRIDRRVLLGVATLRDGL
jgi:hypothetical protein